MTITRRMFLNAAGGAGLLGALGMGSFAILRRPERSEDLPWPDLEETWIPSVCRACPAGCGIRGRIIDRSLVKVEGNPLHPINRGGLCPKGLASVQMAYDPDRPLRCGLRSAELSDGQPLRGLSPDQAVGLLAERIQAAVSAHGPESVAFVTFGGLTATSILFDGLAMSLGQPGAWHWDPDAGLEQAAFETQGVALRPAYDLAHADAVLVFGAGFLEDDASPVRRALDLANLRLRSEGRRPRVIVVEPRFSPSAARADRWVPIRPGTYGDLALGIAHVVLKEGREASAFLREWTEAYDDVTLADGSTVRGFRRLVFEEGVPERVSAVTGVPVDAILEIGKLFASSTHPLAVPCREVTWHGGGVRNAALVHSLNTLVGSLDVPGGVLTPLAAPIGPGPQADTDARTGPAAPRSAERFLLDVAEGHRPPPKVLVLAEVEPEEWPGGSRAWAEVRERVPFVATVTSRPGPSIGAAELVLPAASHLEAWDLWLGPSPIGVTVIGAGRPLIPPPKEARAVGDWILALGSRLGGASARALPWSSAEERVRERLRSIHDSGQGTPFAADIEEEHLMHLEERGFWVASCRTHEEFVEKVLGQGGWWDPFYAYGQFGRVLGRRSGRFRFPTDGRPAASAAYQPMTQAGGGVALRLHLFPVLVFAGGGGAELPWLQQAADAFGRGSWGLWIEINPLTADSLEVEDGQIVEVGNRRGSFRAVARVFEGAMPGLVNVPLGWSPRSEGRYARGRGAGVFPLLGRDRDPESGYACLSSTSVWVRAV